MDQQKEHKTRYVLELKEDGNKSSSEMCWEKDE